MHDAAANSRSDAIRPVLASLADLEMLIDGIAARDVSVMSHADIEAMVWEVRFIRLLLERLTAVLHHLRTARGSI